MKKNIFKTKLNLLITLFFVSHVYANGYITPTQGTYKYEIDLSTSDIGGNIGDSYPTSWSKSGNYAGIIDCPLSEMKNQPVFWSATVPLPPSAKNEGYRVLNNYLDMKVEVYVAGNVNKYIVAPFEDVNNNAYSYSCTPPSSVSEKLFAGSKGKVTFMVTKPLINGIDLSSITLVDTYGRVGNQASGYGPTPTSEVTIQTGILIAPDKCKVNEGQLITVEFGNVSSSGLDGVNYSQPVPIRVQCEGGSFDTGSMNINLAVSGTATTFSNELLNTDKKDLGILLKQNGQTIVPNTFYPLPNMSGNTGNWNLIAAPMANSGAEISEGEFNASATIVAEFQ